MIKKAVINILKKRSFLNLIIKQDVDSTHNIYYVKVKPAEISHISVIPESSPCLSGPEIKYGSFTGCFDLLKFPFDKHFMYRSVKQLLNGDEWNSTPYFKKLVKKRNEKIALKHLKKLNCIIEILSDEGYLSQYQLGKANRTRTVFKWKIPRHETIIGMDRNGKLFRLKGGRHRLAVAQNIGLREMPAILMLYHQNAEHMLPDTRRIVTGDIKDFRPF